MKKELVLQEIEKCIYTKSDSLYLTNMEISDLKELHGLEQCIHLKFLNLSSNKISKIENLEKLSQLTELNLSHNLISKIENLEKLSQFTELNLSHNLIPKVENSEKLNKLLRLNLSYNQISKIENLKNLNKLLRLNLSYNLISKIENLENFNQLRFLDLSKNKISKIENLGKLKQLGVLRLSKNKISKIENLEKLKQLRELHLTNNKVSKIENLEKLGQLKRFFLTNNKVSEIKNIDNSITHFDVIPLNRKKISFFKIIKDVEKMIRILFVKYDINYKITLKVSAQNEIGEHSDIDLNRTLNSVSNHEFIYFYIESFGSNQFISFFNTSLSKLNVLCNGQPHLINYEEHLTINKIRKSNKLIHNIEQKILKAKKVDLIWSFFHNDENIILELISGLLTIYVSKFSNGIIWNEKEKSNNLPNFPFEPKDFNIWFFCAKNKETHAVEKIKKIIANL